MAENPDLIKTPTRDELARMEFKKRKREATADYQKLKLSKKKKLSSQTLGNLGYINEKLKAQIRNVVETKFELDYVVTKIHEDFIDYLRKNYKQFWEKHAEMIIDAGIEENTIRKSIRRGAVT